MLAPQYFRDSTGSSRAPEETPQFVSLFSGASIFQNLKAFFFEADSLYIIQLKFEKLYDIVIVAKVFSISISSNSSGKFKEYEESFSVNWEMGKRENQKIGKLEI